MEILLLLPEALLIGLLIPAVFAGAFAGRARHGWIGVVAVLVTVGPALVLTAIYGWPFDACYTNGGCWEGLLLIPIYASALLTVLAFGIAAYARRPRGTAEAIDFPPQF